MLFRHRQTVWRLRRVDQPMGVQVVSERHLPCPQTRLPDGLADLGLHQDPQLVDRILDADVRRRQVVQKDEASVKWAP